MSAYSVLSRTQIVNYWRVFAAVFSLVYSVPANAVHCANAPVTAHLYSIINQANGNALDISGDSLSYGDNAIQWPYEASGKQQFYLNDLGSGYWTIQAYHSDRVLGVAEGSTEDGANILQWDYRGGYSQQWQLKQADDGAFKIISRQSNKSMTVKYDSGGAYVYQQTDTASPYQRWYLNPVDGNCGSDNHSPVVEITAVPEIISGQMVTLDGSGSFDPDGDKLIYRWMQTNGGGINLPSNSSQTSSFVAPIVNDPESLTFQLIVNDGVVSASANVEILVLPMPDSTAPTTVCDTADENSHLTLSCPSGQVITKVNFASYGTPGGYCGSFSTDTCHASNSVAVVSNACKGMNSCILSADSATFGDPCRGTYKKLAALVSCGMAGNDRVPTISGVPAINAVVNDNYSFTPSASDSDGDSLRFSVRNLPGWASFNPVTGTLEGTPGPGDAGVHSNIIISVSDGANQASLASFSIMVTAVQEPIGSISLSWTAPTTRTDGTSLSLSEIGGYRIFIGKSKDNLQMTVDVGDVSITRYTLAKLEPANYYVAVTAYDLDGNSSSFSNIIETSVTK